MSSTAQRGAAPSPQARLAPTTTGVTAMVSVRGRAPTHQRRQPGGAGISRAESAGDGMAADYSRGFSDSLFRCARPSATDSAVQAAASGSVAAAMPASVRPAIRSSASIPAPATSPPR
jgi:hypothetical protein